MKQTAYILILAALCAGCSDTPTPGAEQTGYGTVRIAATASAEVEAQTRATAQLPAELIPEANRFPLHITGTYQDSDGEHSFDQSWESVDDLEELMTRRGEYKASILRGDIEAEGPALPCFGGEKTFTVLARQTIEVKVGATLLNAAFRIAFDEWFTTYYSEAQITIRTESGYEAAYTESDDELIFVKPSTRLYMKGTAVKAQTGAEVEFPETQIGTSTARTLHTIVVKAAQAGSAGLEIHLDNTFTPVKERLIEMNDEADPVE